MADAKKDEKATPPSPAVAGRKKLVLAIGGGVGVLALAFLAAMMALPKKEHTPELGGPYVAPLTPNKVQVNLNDGHSYMVLDLKVLYGAYDEKYFETRTLDEVCQAEIRDVLVTIASAKSRADVADRINKPVFMEEIRHAVEPLLFPVHVGGSSSPGEPDAASGLAPGATPSSFCGLYEEHALTLDPIAKSIQLDAGEALPYRGDERDLALTAPDGSLLYVDVTRLKPDFAGTLKVGVKGRTRRVLWNEILIQ